MVAAPKFDQVKVGDTLKPIVLPPISRHQLALYCGGSGDHNPIHVDLDFAKKFGFKDVFAHGMLSMGFLGRLVTSYAPRDRIRKLGTRFTSITWPGDVITLSGKVTGKREEGGEKLIDLEVKCTNQNGQDTLQGHATVAAAQTRFRRDRWVRWTARSRSSPDRDAASARRSRCAWCATAPRW
jgi:acyl dehydratase